MEEVELKFNSYEYSEGLENEVITEEDIFKYLVDSEEQTRQVLKENIKNFFNRVPVNIFRDEYYIIYKVLEQANRYGTFFDLDDIYHILKRTGEDFLHDTNIQIHSELKDYERLEAIFSTVVYTYDMLQSLDLETDTNRLLVTVTNYIETYVSNGLEILYSRTSNMYNGNIKKRNGLKYTLDEIRAYKEKVEKMLYGLLEDDLERLSPEINTSTMTVEEIKEILNDETFADDVVRTGVMPVDNAIGGLKKGQYLLVQAGSGVGKTKFSTINMVHNAIVNGKNVLVDSIELTSRVVFNKIVVRHIAYLYDTNEVVSGLGEKRFDRGNFTIEEQRYVDNAIIDLVTNINYGKLLVTDEQVDVETLESRLETHWDKGFHFDLYVLDYIGLVSSQRGMNKKEIIAETSNILKRTVKNFKGRGFATIVVSQLSKEAEKLLYEGDLNAGKYGTADAIEPRRDCDVMLTLHQDDEMAEAMKMYVLIDKARFSNLESGHIFECHANRDTNVFTYVPDI